MARIIPPQFWVAYDEDPPTNSGMTTKEECIMLNDSWTNIVDYDGILFSVGHKEYKCVDADDQTSLKWDNIDGTPFNY